MTDDLGLRDIRISDLETSLATTASDLQRALEESAARQAAIDGLTSDRDLGLRQISDLRRQLSVIQDNLESALEQAKILIAQRAELRGRLDETIEANRLVKEERDQFASRLEESEIQSATLEKEVAAARSQERSYLADIDSLQAALTEAEDESARNSRQIEDLLAQLERVTASLADETARADTAETERLKALEDIAVLQESLGAATRESEAQLAAIVDFERQIAGLKEHIASLADQNRDVGELYSTTLEELETARQENQVLLVRAEDAADDLFVLDLELEEMRREAEETLTLLAAAKQARIELENSLDALRREFRQASEALSNIRTEQAAALDRQSELESTLADRQAVLDATKQERNQALETVAQLEESLAAVNEELETQRRSRDDAETRFADAKGELEIGAQTIADLEALLATRDGELRTASSKLEQYGTQLAEFRLSVEQLEAAGSSRSEENLRLQRLLDEQEQTISFLSVERNRANSQLDSIRSQLESAAELRSLMERAVAEMQQSLERSEEIQQAALQAALQDADRVRELRNELEQSRHEIADLEAKNREITESLERAVQSSSNNAVTLRIAEDMLARSETGRKESESALAEERRQVAALNLQVNDLRKRLEGLQLLLDESAARSEQQKEASELEISSLGTQLNEALAELAAESARAFRLEEAERKRLEEQKEELEGFRSEFLGRLRTVMEGQTGVRIKGDRFVFASEVLFPLGRADLSEDGKEQITRIARLILDLADEFPESIDWVLRVDGHTDDRPIIAQRDYSDNWELSQARSLSVVRFLTTELGFPQNRLAAAGFGEHRPVNPGRTDEERSLNRRIEFKLTEP